MIVGNQAKLLESGFKIVKDLPRQFSRCRQVIRILQRVILEPEDVEAGFVASDQIGIVVAAPAAGGVLRAPGGGAGLGDVVADRRIR